MPSDLSEEEEQSMRVQHQASNVFSGSKNIEDDDDQLPMDQFYLDGTQFDIDE